MKKDICTNVIFPRRKAFLFLVFILQLAACPCLGQVLQKKILNVNDYSKWGQLNLNGLNENGSWVSYTLSYENGIDTLFLKNTKSMLSKSFPAGTNGRFVNSDWFIFQTTKEVHLVNLKTGLKEIIKNAIQYDYSPNTRKLLILLSQNDNQRTLLIRKLNGTDKEQIASVDNFIMDPALQMVLYTSKADTKHEITLLDLSKKNKITILGNSSGSFDNLVWHPKGKSVAFMEMPLNPSESKMVFYYDLHGNKIYKLDIDVQNELGDSLSITDKSHKLKISDDMQKVFFSVKRKTKLEITKVSSEVQLWNGNAKWIYPMEEKRKHAERTYLALWEPFKDNTRLLSNDTLPQIMLTGNQRYAILSNKKQYEPQYDYESPRDFYIMDLSSGKSELLLKKHSGNMLRTTASPNGKYIAYFKQKNWWIYDILKKSHTNITKNLKSSFFHNDKQYPNNTDVDSSIFWTMNGKEILLCDEYDIWAINTNGTSAQRLTSGRETQIKFRLAGYSLVLPARSNYDGIIFDSVDLHKGLLLEAGSVRGYSGFYKWSPKFNKNLVYSTSTLLNQFTQSADGTTFVYLEQRYDVSPRLMIKNQSNDSSKLLVQSNPQQEEFYWGKAKLIHYKNTKGDSRSGILYYPAQYNSQKKYPMIVYIYEKLSNDFYKYIAPSQLEDRGFNITTFTTQGYFVLLPDISYQIGKPGLSAADCVVSATKEIIHKEMILPNRVGLIGHSFGGYETNFIITQTDLYAAAVSGSGASDLTNFYLTVGATGRSNMWRFENQQWRMGKSLFDDREGYNSNSPIEHAENITTPLLSWTGESDKQMNWNQSAALYLALHRLNKEHIMLVYPKEGHTILKPVNQKDLSMRIHDWFDYKLKDLPPSTWIKDGLQ